MSANFYVRPLPKNPGKSLSVVSSFREVLEEAFGENLPMVLDHNSVPTLKGMAAADKGLREAIGIICDQIDAHDEVEIRVEY